MSGQDVVRQTLEGEPRIVEVEVEYRKGNKAKFDLVPGDSATRQAQIDRLIEAVKWGKVEEVEIEFIDGKKKEIDLEVKGAKKKSKSVEVAEAVEAVEAAEAAVLDETETPAEAATETVAEESETVTTEAVAETESDPSTDEAAETTVETNAETTMETTIETIGETTAEETTTVHEPIVFQPPIEIVPIEEARRQAETVVEPAHRHSDPFAPLPGAVRSRRGRHRRHRKHVSKKRTSGTVRKTACKKRATKTRKTVCQLTWRRRTHRRKRGSGIRASVKSLAGGNNPATALLLI